MAYLKIIILVLKFKDFSVINFQWFLFPPIDYIFLLILKNICPHAKFIFTSHNVLPHRNSLRFIGIYKKIINKMNYVIYHGQNLIDEAIKIFGDNFQSKFKKQYIGLFDKHYFPKLKDNKFYIDRTKFNKVYIFFGFMYYNKGVDILLNYWLKNFKNSNSLLLCVGKMDSNFNELKSLTRSVPNVKNLIFLDEFLKENYLNYLISISDLILMPYRGGSMTGNLQKAFEHRKLIMTTNFGSISEYLPKDYKYIHNSFTDLFESLKAFENKNPREIIFESYNFHSYLHNNFLWSNLRTSIINIFSS